MGRHEETLKVIESSTDHSLISEIKIEKLSEFHSGIVSCRPKRLPTLNTDSFLKEDSLQFNLKVSDIIPASVDLLQTNLLGETTKFWVGKNVSFACPATGNPSPTILWMKDGKTIDFETQVPKVKFVLLSRNQITLECPW